MMVADWIINSHSPYLSLLDSEETIHLDRLSYMTQSAILGKGWIHGSFPYFLNQNSFAQHLPSTRTFIAEDYYEGI